MGEIVRRLLRLGLPITIGRTGVIGMGITDLIVVGQLASDELAHLSLALALVGVLVHGGIALLLGVQVTAGRAFGARDLPLAGIAWRRGCVISCIAGGAIALLVVALGRSFFGALGVAADLVEPATRIASILALSIPLHLLFIASTHLLEGIERPTPGAAAMWMAIVINLALNLLLVPRFGAEGSAWTTVVSRLFLASGMLGYVMLARAAKPVHRAGASTIGYGALLGIGAAAMVSAVVEAGAFSAMGIIAARISGDALATVNIATGGLLSLLAMIALGLGSAAAILVAQALGRGDARLARRTGWVAFAVNAGVFVLLGVLCTLLAEQIALAFTSSAAIASLFAASMWLVAILFTPDCGQMVVDPALRASGDNWFPTAVRFVAFVAVAPAAAIWLVEIRGFGVEGVFLALIAASGLAFVALLVRWTAWTQRAGFGGTAIQ